jgi:hypothetical protein
LFARLSEAIRRIHDNRTTIGLEGRADPIYRFGDALRAMV